MKNMPNSTPAPPELSSGETTRSSAIASDGIDRQNFLRCMAWVGTGVIWTMTGGVPTSKLFAAVGDAAGKQAARGAVRGAADFSFVQISDSHIGFNKAANQDVAGTLRLAIDKINDSPGAAPMVVPAGKLEIVLGVTNVQYIAKHSHLAIIDSSLADKA